MTGDAATQEAALNAFGIGMFVALGMVALSIVSMTYHRLVPRQTALGRAMAYLLIGAFPASFAWITFNPAVQALGLINSPAMFALTGFFAAVFLVVIRTNHKATYGLVEVLVAFVTLMALGQLYDPDQPLTTLIAFVGAVYVMVRGFTNVGEAMEAARKKGQEGTNQER